MNNCLKKIKELNKQNIIIFEYSAKKIKVKQEDPNSVLNPLTNSLSPSEKSKGERFNSPNILGIQMYKQIGIKKLKFVGLKKQKSVKFKHPKKKKIKKKMKYKEDS